MSSSPRRPSAPPVRFTDATHGSATGGGLASLLLLAVGATAGVALLLGARRALSTEATGRPDRRDLAPRGERRRRQMRVPTSPDQWPQPALLQPDELERRVLEAFRNDPILCERPVDIGADDAATIELTGWVDAPTEIAYARTLARGVPGVARVTDQLSVQPEARPSRQRSRELRGGRPRPAPTDASRT